MKTYRPALSGLLAAAAMPALAQGGYQQQSQPAQQPPEVQQQRQPAQQQQAAPIRLSREETAAIRPLSEAVRTQNWAGAAAALPAAQAGATTPPARFEVGRLQLQLGQGTQNREMQLQGVDAMLASGGAPATAMPTLLGARASIAIQASDWPTAERMLTQVLELQPNNTERLFQLAEVKIALNNNGAALALYQRLLQALEPAGQQPTEQQLRRTAALATDQRNTQLAAQLNDRLLRAYPNAASWQAVLVALRQGAGEDLQLGLDVRRLMLVAGALPRAGDYVDFASRLDRAGQWGEAKAVLDQGVARGTVNASDSTVRQMMTTAEARIREDRPQLGAMRTRALAAATGREARIAGDTHYGYGEYAAAAELYRASLQKGGEDANLLNTRLGASLARAGRTAEAQAAFRAVTGPRAALAGYWLVWMERGTQPAAQPAPAQPTQPARPTQ
ncbi:tetratricopeptide repeat protein [Sphingosinicella sp.]|uniref:tetratricopeptide repeat protein n=1 Tax=Sphingosinicella sp. TaxID=1917971 RepID=UPI0040383633